MGSKKSVLKITNWHLEACRVMTNGDRKGWIYGFINVRMGSKKSVLKITNWHLEACRVMTNGDRKGWIFLSYSHTNNGFFFLLAIKFRIFIIPCLFGIKARGYIVFGILSICPSIHPPIHPSFCLSLFPPSSSKYLVGNFSYSFMPIPLELYRCLDHSLKMCIIIVWI